MRVKEEITEGWVCPIEFNFGIHSVIKYSNPLIHVELRFVREMGLLERILRIILETNDEN